MTVLHSDWILTLMSSTETLLSFSVLFIAASLTFSFLCREILSKSDIYGSMANNIMCVTSCVNEGTSFLLDWILLFFMAESSEHQELPSKFITQEIRLWINSDSVVVTAWKSGKRHWHRLVLWNKTYSASTKQHLVVISCFGCTGLNRLSCIWNILGFYPCYTPSHSELCLPVGCPTNL